MLKWEKLPEYELSELTLEKVQELAKGLQPFAVTGVAWEGIEFWDDLDKVGEAMHDDDDADLMIFSQDTLQNGSVKADIEDTIPAKQGLSLVKGPSVDGALYLKYSITNPKMLEPLPFKNFFIEKQLSPVSIPLLLKPFHYFTWLYVGQWGSGSKPHIDILNSSAWLTVVTGEKKWLLIHGSDYASCTSVDDEGSPVYPDLFQAYSGKDVPACLEKATVYEYTQKPGTSIFVPPKCIHAVRNENFSISLTHNFVDRVNQSHWENAIKDIMGV
eukprot:TRINITY_DN34703_c0_g1_i1.p1 TRINITY_DN34703_c0_g1~~TRINITY_DN34703_c0_g1_i1.p1  ORF type:complete len:272 (+),score=32.27 TRINITY_DN34703_c0_g1_i1:31-846(+)